MEHLRSVDSRKCLSYWNIENKGPIPQEFRKPMGEWLLGCDICQEVCPWNSHAARSGKAEPAVELIDVEEILAMSEAEFAQRFEGRALSRPKLSGLQRNARIVKENLGD